MNVTVWEVHPQAGGGSESVSLEIAEELAKRGHDISLVYVEPGSLLERYRACCGCVRQTRFAPIAVRKPWRAVESIRAVAAAAKECKTEVVFSSHLGLIRLAAFFRVVTGIPSVFHLGLMSPEATVLDLWAQRRIAAGVAPSDHTAANWRRWGTMQGRIFVVPNWVQSTRFKPAEDRETVRAQFSLGDRPTVLFLGRVVPEKGIELLIRSFARVAVDHSILVIVGPVLPSYESFLRGLASECGVRPDRLRFVGPSAYPERWYASADLVVVPSQTQETFGLTLVESMSTGTLVLATDVGIFPGILGTEHQDLIIVPPLEEDLAIKIEFWLQRPESARIKGRQLRQRAVMAFNHETSCDRYAEILSQAIVKSSG